ncbi:hypothetical protein KX816_06165 [Sphingosinicellaceae bacterium]|nr:hypothetical protein KX816_06165 [Sphingosinicellaceae bacterium]
MNDPGLLNDNEAGFRPAAIIAVVAVGTVGMMVPGLQPQLLGALAHDGRLTASALGLLATVELLTMGIAAGASSFVLPVTRLRLIAAVAIILTAALDLITPSVGGWLLLVVRAVTGVAEGVLTWIAIGLIVRSIEPARWSGIYLLVQTLAQLGLATLLGLYVIPSLGSTGGFAGLGLFTLLGLAALPWLPERYQPIETGHETSGLPPARGLVALAGVLLYLGFIIAVWVYVEPLGLERGIDAATLAVVTPLSLGMQVVGVGFATVLAERIPALLVVILVAAANLALLAVMGLASSATAFVGATAIFGLLWLFAMPFMVPLVIAADPSRRAAVLIGGAQLVGASLGPLAASFLVTDTNVAPVLWFGATSLVLAVGAFAAATSRRPAAPALP